MRTLTIGLAQAALVGALLLASSAPAEALELPDIHVLSGETYPASASGEIEGTEVAELETELGEKLKFKTVAITFAVTELSSLGPSSNTFAGVTEARSKTACNTVGDPSGTVKFSSEYHIVDTSTSPLTANLLLLFKELVVECNSGKAKIKVRSPVVGRMMKITSGTEVTEFGLVFKCSGKGKQELKEYLNDEGASTKAVLTANFGLGFESASLCSTKEIVEKATKMSDFLF